MIFLHVQHVSAVRISHGKAARPSVCLSVRRVPIPRAICTLARLSY